MRVETPPPKKNQVGKYGVALTGRKKISVMRRETLSYPRGKLN
jgi:hypothetical protein